MKTQYFTRTTLVIALCGFSWAAQAHRVLEWNHAALEAIRARNTPPPAAARNLAIIHIAIHDAVNSISRTHEAFTFAGHVPAAASPEAAACAAGYHAISALYPHPDDQAAFLILYFAQLSGIPDLPPKQMGILAGQAAAAAIVQSRQNDGSDQAGEFAGGTEPGQWRPHISFGGRELPALLPAWGSVTPFGLMGPDQFRPPAPTPLSSEQYAREFNEVKLWGAKEGSSRDEDQTRIALFWGYGPGSATPPGHWNEIAHAVAQTEQLNLELRF
jgi:hypothetical protein